MLSFGKDTTLTGCLIYGVQSSSILSLTSPKGMLRVRSPSPAPFHPLKLRSQGRRLEGRPRVVRFGNQESALGNGVVTGLRFQKEFL